MEKSTSLCIFLFIIIFPITAPCQVQYELDSLITKLESAPEDTSKVLLLFSISDLYERSKQDSSLFYLEKAKVLSDRLKFTNGMFKYYEKSAITFFTKGDYARAMDASNHALDLAKEMKNDDFVINILNTMGIIYQYLGKFDKQLDYSLQALTRIEERKNFKKLSNSYHSIGNAYLNLKQYRKSLEYCLRALEAHEKYGANLYANRILASIGQDYNYLGIPDSALYFFHLAIKESLKKNDKYAEAAIYGYMTDVYSSQNDFTSMLNVSEKSLALSKELQSRQILASSLYNLAFAHYYQHHQKLAKAYIQEAREIAEADSLFDELENIYIILSYISAQEGDFKTSLWAKSKTDSIQATVLNDKVVKATTEWEAKYESEKRDIQIKLQQVQLKEKSVMNFVLLGATAFILVFSLLAFRNYKQKQKLQQQRISELETEKQLAATEAVLKGEEQERSRLAKDLHDGLGGMLSGIKYSFNTMKENLIMTPENHLAFERSMDMLDSSIKEMRRVAHNMMPESLVRFGLDAALKDFCNDINQSGALQINYQSIGLTNVQIEQTTAITLYRIVQELINNTLKHAAAKTAIVQVTKAGDQLSVTVEDDGKGFDTEIIKQAKGMGWSNIQHRVDFLKAKLDVDSKPDRGTSVHIELNM